jgi:hypothetical protein
VNYPQFPAENPIKDLIYPAKPTEPSLHLAEFGSHEKSRHRTKKRLDSGSFI